MRGSGAGAARVVRTGEDDEDDADDDDDGDGDVPAHRPAPAALRLAVAGTHGGAPIASRDCGMAKRGYPVTRGRSGRAPSARAAIAMPARTASSTAAGRSRRRRAPRQLLVANRYDGPVVADDHAVGVPIGADRLDVHDGSGRLVGHPPAEAPEAPAEVDVLHVHEVVLVPSPDRLKRRAAEPHRGAREPLHVTGPGGIDVELAVPAGEAVRRAHEAEQRVTHRVARRRNACGPRGTANRRGS